MTSDSAMEVEENPLEPMESSSTSSSGEEESGQEDMEGSDQEEIEQEAANPAFSKFMQGFWDLASVDVPVRWVGCGDSCDTLLVVESSLLWMDLLCCDFASLLSSHPKSFFSEEVLLGVCSA